MDKKLYLTNTVQSVCLLACLLGTILVSGSVYAEEATIPAGYTPERYQRIWKKSPFTVASVIDAPPVDTSSFTDSLTLVGLVTIGNKPLVTIRTNDSQEDQLVEAEKPNASGLQVVSFVNDLDPTKVQVVLKKGDLSGTLHFTINETAAVAPNNPEGVQPPRIIQPRVIQNVPRPMQPNVPRAQAPTMTSPKNTPVFRRRPLTLPGAPTNTNRPGTNNRPVPPRGNVIPPP